MKDLHLLAFDFGASSGRAISGTFDGSRLGVRTVHQFPNGGIDIAGHLYWDILRFAGELEEGIRRADKEMGTPPGAIGIDTWGVDFGLLDKDGDLLGNPYHYRDRRTEGMEALAFTRMPREEIFRHTGLAFQPFNTLYQLLAMREQKPELLDRASTLLLMPDLLAYLLTGIRGTEYTDASTTQLLDVGARTWSDAILHAMGFPRSIFMTVAEPGAVRGMLRGQVAGAAGVPPVPVIAVAGHDTASAVVAVPLRGPRSAYLSSGTWSLLGVETETPLLSNEVLEANFTNEGGFGGRYRVLHNVMGLWIVQECKREWDAAGDVAGYDELVRRALENPALVSLIDPDDATFYPPGPMEHRIRAYCRRTQQREPDTRGALVRCVYESLALKYRWVVERLETILKTRIAELVIVGGGARNSLLNQCTANALQRPVIAGPSEATAVGNLLVQLYALREVDGLDQMRAIVRASFPEQEFVPEAAQQWEDAYRRFLCVMTLGAHSGGAA